MGDFIHFHILNILGALDNLFNANQKMKTLFNLTSSVIEGFPFSCKIWSFQNNWRTAFLPDQKTVQDKIKERIL